MYARPASIAACASCWASGSRPRIERRSRVSAITAVVEVSLALSPPNSRNSPSGSTTDAASWSGEGRTTASRCERMRAGPRAGADPGGRAVSALCGDRLLPRTPTRTTTSTAMAVSATSPRVRPATALRSRTGRYSAGLNWLSRLGQADHWLLARGSPESTGARWAPGTRGEAGELEFDAHTAVGRARG